MTRTPQDACFNLVQLQSYDSMHGGNNSHGFEAIRSKTVGHIAHVT